jgi:hypothetical protein
MMVNAISAYQVQPYGRRNVKFRGAGGEVISEGLRDFVSEALPLYKAGRMIKKIGDGDTKGAIKQGVGVADNIILQPVKQTAALAVATKFAAIGTAICPGLGTVIGGGLGYFGTLLGWGKARNTIVDACMD